MKKVMNGVSELCGRTGVRLIIAASVLLTAVGCSEDEVADGRVLNTIILPVDFALDLYCPDVGLANELCILDDPNNAYARAAINDENKFELNDNSPSAKARFYLWGTAQARIPGGENQYYTGRNLHELFSQGSDPDARLQAKRAYRSVLDNYFDHVTFSEVRPDGSQDEFPLKDIVGGLIYSPGSSGFAQLFDSQTDALANLNQWGYVYDTGTRIITKAE